MRTLRGALVIAAATLLETIRNRLLIVALLFSLVLLVLSVAAASISIAERARLIVDVGLAASSGLGTLMAIALSINTLAGELKNHTAFPLLARPLPRWGFILGKYLGVLASMIIVVTIMNLGTVATVLVYGASVPGALWSCLLLNWVEMAVVIAISFAFSSLSVPTLAAAFSAGVILAGNLSSDVQSYARLLRGKGEPMGAVLERLYYVLPDLQDLSARIQAANDMSVPATFLLTGLGYGLAYAAAAILIAMWSFSRRKAI